MRPGSRNGRSGGWRSARPAAAASWSSDSASRTTRSAPTPPTSPMRRRPTPRSASAALFAFDAGRREGIAPQLTSLEYVPAMGGFLVLTATVGADNAFHGNTLWLVNNGQPNVARSYATFEAGMKAGGLAVLGVKATGHQTEIKLLITYDNDPHATKLPSRFQTACSSTLGTERGGHWAPRSGSARSADRPRLRTQESPGLRGPRRPHLGRPPVIRSSRSRSRWRTGCNPASPERSLSSRGSADSS